MTLPSRFPVRPISRSIGRREAAPVTPSAEQAVALDGWLAQAEFYQPLYGVRREGAAVRACRDRAQTIEGALTPLGPRFRLIDFGSSLGYFVFHFADRGARAEGVDFRASNVAVAEAVRRINGLGCSFRCGALTLDSAREMPASSYDVALLLSILHHIVHDHGLEYAQQLIAELLTRIPILILELAHRHEEVPYPWRASQPEDPLEVLAACRGFRVEKLGDFATHLSSVPRPLIMVVREDFKVMRQP